jgi:type I restriction enzyme M protein
MGIVLPEGFLNGSDLQKVRDFVESRAKILLIVSVPQEVFISAGATVKSSLVFLKKFTAEEEIEYKQIVKDVTDEINEKYQPEIDEHHKTYQVFVDEVKYQQSYIKEVKAIKTSKSEKETQLMLANMSLGEVKAAQKLGKIELDKQLKGIDLLIQSEIKAEVKTRFNYSFPIVQAEKAGISSTGQKTDNDLIAIQAEFADYCLQAKPYQAQLLKCDYAIGESGELIKEESLINF